MLDCWVQGSYGVGFEDLTRFLYDKDLRRESLYINVALEYADKTYLENSGKFGSSSSCRSQYLYSFRYLNKVLTSATTPQRRYLPLV